MMRMKQWGGGRGGGKRNNNRQTFVGELRLRKQMSSARRVATGFGDGGEVSEQVVGPNSHGIESRDCK
jgi:hypothetical protein